VDPREFNQAQERIQTLLRENEVLKTGLEQEKKRSGGPELEQTRAALTNANTQLADTRATNQRLDAEKQALQSQLAGAITAAGAIHALRAENERLKQQLTQTTETNRATATRLATLESEKQVLRLERTALEMRLKQVLGKTADKSGNVARGPEAEQLRELERQRDQLQKQLNEVMFEVRSLKSRQLPPQLADLNPEIESLRARVEVFEARAIPYSPEELALFQKPPAPTSATASPGPAALPPASNTTSSNTFALMAEAERSFAARDYARAEENYRTLLLQNATNAALHANLAAVHLEAGQLDQAETQLNAALAADPNDAHATALLGHLKFRQKKFDEAIEALNRAAKLNPRDADVQNLLGVALSQKGLRGPAEQAFRKAIVLSGNHAGAHHNLAVFYATENPPNLPLARFHYQKARSLGHEKNPDLEQLLTRSESAGAN
jgi:Flp pilus assembly protein TadD